MATAGRTRVLYLGNTASSGAAVNVQRTGNIYGVVQCDFAEHATKKFRMEIQGRVDSSMNWAILAVLDETDMDANASALISVRLMPTMKAEVTSVGGAPSVNGISAKLLE